MTLEFVRVLYVKHFVFSKCYMHVFLANKYLIKNKQKKHHPDSLNKKDNRMFPWTSDTAENKNDFR